MNNETQKVQKSSTKFRCCICDYNTCRKSQYNRHILTSKHLTKINETNETSKVPNNLNDIIKNENSCNCGKTFHSRITLWRHKKKCKPKEEEPTIPVINQNVVMEILKQNDELKNLLVEQSKEFKGMIMEICKNGINNTNCNNNNKTFNLQFFLNEQCKDAMNMADFINSLHLTLEDAENVGKLGYVRGISNIIIDNLKALDIYKRPIHCTDTKREVMYVKDENKWEKETEEYKMIRGLIKSITFKNGKNIRLFKEKHPCCGTSESIYSDQYSKMYIEGFGGTGTDRENENKIIKRMAREVMIGKHF